MPSLKTQKKSPSSCVLCQNLNDTESTTHLFLHCPFPINIWHLFIINANSSLRITCLSQFFSLKQVNRFNLTNPAWIAIVHAIFWIIWITRNNKIFRGLEGNIQLVVHQIISSASFWTGQLIPDEDAASNNPQTIRNIQAF